MKLIALCLVALQACAWATATFGDPPGPVLCHPTEGFACRGGALVPLDRGARRPAGDAGQEEP